MAKVYPTYRINYDIPCVKLSFLIYKSIIKSEIVVKTSRIIIDKYFICDIKNGSLNSNGCIVLKLQSSGSGLPRLSRYLFASSGETCAYTAVIIRLECPRNALIAKSESPASSICTAIECLKL